jgi:hypothetical protein
MAVVITGNNTPTAGGVVYGDGTTYATTTAGTSGQPLVSGGSGAPAFRPYTLPAADGSASQVLQTNGAGALSFATPSAGALVYISSQTVSSPVGSVDFTSGISSTYDDYVVYFSNVTPVNNNVNMRLRFYKSGAFQSSGYSTSSASFKTTAALQSSNILDYIYMSDLTISNSVSVVSGTCTLLNMNSALGNRATAVGQLFFNSATSAAQSTTIFGGSQSTAAATTGFQFFFSSGNVNSGTFRLYGVAKA